MAETQKTGQPADLPDEALFAQQDKLFGRKEGKNGTSDPEFKQKSIKTPKRDRARDIVQRTAEVNAQLKTERQQAQPKKEDAPKENNGEIEFDQVPEFLNPEKLFGNEQSPETKPEPRVDDEPEPNEEPVIEEKGKDFNAETNLGNLRRIASDFKRQAETLKTENEKLKNRPDSNALSQELSKARARISELETYEKIHALQNNPDFKARYIDGEKVLIDEAKAIAKDYGIDGNEIVEVLGIQNRRDLDAALEELFSHSSARQDIKNIKQKRDTLLTERKTQEQQPKQTLEQLEASRFEREAEDKIRRKQYLDQAKVDGWTRAIDGVLSLPQEEKIYELVEVPGNQDHNEKIARPTIESARQLFDSGVNHLEQVIQHKAKLTPNFLSFFATLCQQAAATRTVNFTRNSIYKEYQALQASIKKKEGSARPGLNTPSRNGNSNGTPAPVKGNHSIAAKIFGEVMRETENK